MCRSVIARPFEPVDRLVRVRLQQMHERDLPIPKAERGITRAEPNGLLYQRDRLLYRPAIELALAESEERIYPVPIQREHRLVFGNGLRRIDAARAATTFGVMRKWTAGRCCQGLVTSPFARSISAAAEAVIPTKTRLASAAANWLCASKDLGQNTSARRTG